MTDKNREIEEIRKDLIEIFDEEYDKRRLITADFTAEALYNAGYRKKSENTVEVVRCKDCQRKQIDAFGRTVCVRNGQMIVIQDEDYCSYAERR